MTLRLGSGLEETTVGEAMHIGVLCCPPEAPLREVAEIMGRHRIHSVVVCEGPREAPTLYGLVSDADLVGAAAADDVSGRTAFEAARTPVVTICGSEPVRRGAALMQQHGVAHLVVVSPETDRPVGVLSSLDVARAVVSEPRRTW